MGGGECERRKIGWGGGECERRKIGWGGGSVRGGR